MFAVAIGFVIPGPGPAALGAQEGPDVGSSDWDGSRVPEPLSLEAAIALALEHSPTHARAVNGAAVVRSDERRALGEMLPTLSAWLSFTGTTARTKTAFDDFGQPTEAPSYEKSTTSSTSQGLAGRVALFDLASIRTYGAARALTGAEAAAGARDVAALRTRVGRAYFQLVERQALIVVEEGVLRTAEDQLWAIRALLRVAARQPTDVLGAELSVAQAEQSLSRARGEARKAALILNEVMGVPLGRTFALMDALPTAFDPDRLSEDSLARWALRRSPAVLEAEARKVAAERGVSAARAGRLPSLSLEYSWGRGANLREYAAFRELHPENSSWSFGLRVAVPLLPGLQASASVEAAKLSAESARASLREARLAVERAARSAAIDLRDGCEAVRLAERSAEIARERLAQGQELYRLGTLDYTLLRQISDQVATAERQLLSARYALADALVQVEEQLRGSADTGG